MNIKLATVVVDCQDAHRTATFYSKLLGWPITLEEPDWVLLRDPKGGTGLSFQTEEGYVRPVWPEEPGKPTKMLHLDFKVDDLPPLRKPMHWPVGQKNPPSSFWSE